VRSVSCGVMPATVRSTSSNSAACISNIPISSHCFCRATTRRHAPPHSCQADRFEHLVDDGPILDVSRASSIFPEGFGPASPAPGFRRRSTRSNTVRF